MDVYTPETIALSYTASSEKNTTYVGYLRREDHNLVPLGQVSKEILHARTFGRSPSILPLIWKPLSNGNVGCWHTHIPHRSHQQVIQRQYKCIWSIMRWRKRWWQKFFPSRFIEVLE